MFSSKPSTNLVVAQRFLFSLLALIRARAQAVGSSAIGISVIAARVSLSPHGLLCAGFYFQTLFLQPMR